MSTGGYDPIEDMVKVKSVQKKWRDSFTGTDLNPGKWTQQLGNGASLGVAGGVLTMGSGVVAGDIAFLSPLRGTANAALNVQAVTAGSVVIANLQGYAAP
jgi:hypothetical protein